MSSIFLPEEDTDVFDGVSQRITEQVRDNSRDLAISFQNMGLMGGSPPSVSAGVTIGSSPPSVSAGVTIVAPPPSAAPPLPPPDESPNKEHIQPDTNGDSSMQALLVRGRSDRLSEGVSALNKRTQGRQEALMESLTASMHAQDGNGLFGDDDLQENGAQFFESEDEDEGLFHSSVEHQGMLITSAPPVAPPSVLRRSKDALTTSDDHDQACTKQNQNAVMMSSPPPDESFYRNHDAAFQPKLITDVQKPVWSNKTRHPSNLNKYDYHPNSSNASIGSTSTISTLPAPSLSPAPLRNNGKLQSETNSQRKTKTFLVPDYVNSFVPRFAQVQVYDPRHVSSDFGVAGLLSSLAGSSPKFWVYTVSSTQPSNNKTLHVQRRFRHFDALQDRLREACPGAILPSRPAKHTARAIEEGAAAQSPAFATQRAKELHNYLNALVRHPIAGNSEPLTFFLTFLDADLGTAWPEVSSSAITRLAVGMSKSAVGGGPGSSRTALVGPVPDWPATSLSFDIGTASQTSAAALAVKHMDDNSELVQLASEEQHRMNLVSQAIPKIEAFLILLGDWQEKQGALAMECTKLAKDMGNEDRPLSLASDLLSTSLLRCARRTRRMVVESHAALDSYLQEPRLIRMEKQAFQDRRDAFMQWWNYRQAAEHKSQKLMLYKQNGIAVQRSKFEAEAAHMEQCMQDASQRAQDIGHVLQSEVLRISSIRQKEWMAGLKIWICSMKEAQTELKSIWQDAKANYHNKTFPTE